MRNLTITLTLLILTLINSCKKEVKGPEQLPTESSIQKFDQKISQLTKDLNIENYSYAIVSNARIVTLSEKGISTDKQVQLGNMQHMLLSAFLLRTTEDQELDIDDRLANYGVSGAMGDTQVKSVLAPTYFTSQPANENSNDVIYPILQTISKNDAAGSFQSTISKKLDLPQTKLSVSGNQLQCYSTLSDLITFSMAIDNQQIFESTDTHEEMFRPVYLATGERSPSGLGCFIDISDERKLIWSAGQTSDFSTLMIKSETDSLSFIMVAESNRLNTPFNLEDGDISKTPFCYAFENQVLSVDSTNFDVDFYGSMEDIKNSLLKGIESGNRDEMYNQLVAQLRIASYMKNGQRLMDLSNLYDELFPRDIVLDDLLKKPVVKIKAFSDYVQYHRSFEIPKDEELKIFATGEYAKEMTMQPWQYDNVEMYFDLLHERTTSFQGNRDDRQYRFDYDFDELTGSAPSFEGVKFVQFDPSPNQFNFEIAIPWKTLFNTDTLNPTLNQFIGFDIASADNDGGEREGSLAWHSTLDQTPWTNTSLYGSMQLVDNPGRANDTLCYSIKTTSEIAIDGKNDGEWNGIPRYAIDNEFMSGITGPDDQSGWFRLQWDDSHLYLFIEIQDDFKRKIEKSADFGWLVRNEQDTVWMFTEEESQHSGGHPSNKFIYETIQLPAGKYDLFYQTNKSHSMRRWSKERPDLSFYGVALYEN